MKVDAYVDPLRLLELAEKDLGASYEFLTCSFSPTKYLSERITIDAKRIRKSTILGLQVLYITK